MNSSIKSVFTKILFYLASLHPSTLYSERACLFTPFFRLSSQGKILHSISVVSTIPYFLFILTVTLLLLSGQTYGQKKLKGQLQVTVTDKATGEITPVRVRLTRNGYVVKSLPKKVIGIRYGLWDHPDGYSFQPDSSYYVGGSFQLELAPGTYQLAISKGNEYLSQSHQLQVQAGKIAEKKVVLDRWINTPKMGWYSGDDHIHIRRNSKQDSLIMTWTKAEDIHVGVLLQMGDYKKIYYGQHDFGEKGVYTRKDYLLTSGQEDPRTPELGHALGIGAADYVRFQEEYYLYDKVFDSLRTLGGMTGYAHQGKSFAGYRGLILDGLRKKVDGLELLQFCVSEQPLIVDHYYHLLDLGFAVTALAGSDFPWCGRDHDNGPPERNAQIGNARFYTYLDKPFSYKSWREGLAKGHTYVSSGPVLDFKVNNALPGDTLHPEKGEKLTILAQAYGHASQVPLERLEIVGHGEVLAKVSVKDEGQSSSHLSLELELPVEGGIWLAARTYGNASQAAHTTPVYVSVENKGFHNPQTASKYLSLSEEYLQELENELNTISKDPERQAWRYKAKIQIRIDQTREVIDMLRTRVN